MRRSVMNRLTQERLVDELVQAYVDWREACARVDAAYRSWASDPAPGDRVTFGVYLAALDEEEQAAESYAGLVRRAERMPGSKDPPVGSLGGPGW
jgi:hypothetical protein